MTKKRPNHLRTGGYAWGPTRVRADMSMRELERLSGVHRSILSMAEIGRLVPTGVEFAKVMAVLEAAASAAGASIPPGGPVAE